MPNVKRSASDNASKKYLWESTGTNILVVAISSSELSDSGSLIQASRSRLQDNEIDNHSETGDKNNEWVCCVYQQVLHFRI